VVGRFGLGAVRIIPGISSVQMAFARLGLDWADARILSAHGRTPEIALHELPRWDKIVVLAGSREALQWSAVAARALEASHAAILCENLTLDDERVRPMTPDQLDDVSAASLSLVLLIRRGLMPCT
jgi:precorrin-6B methylase 1